MAQYSIEDLERLSALTGQGGTPETSRDQTGDVTLPDVPAAKSDIRRDIYTVCLMNGQWMTVGQVARTLHLKKTGWLYRAFEDLVEAGYLVKYVQSTEGGLPTFFYKVAR